MKSSWKVKAVALLSAVAMLFCGCQVSLTCLSHIDRDSNGKCDNCGTKMKIVIKDVENLTIKTYPVKNYYTSGETIDVTGGVLLVEYNDGKPAAEIPFTHEEVEITAPGMSTLGKKTVNVTYHNKSVRFPIEVGLNRYTVSFDLGYENAPAIENQLITINEYATAPETPVRDGFDFIGWFTSKDYTKEFNFKSTQITGDTTVYVQWMKTYTITYVDFSEDGNTTRNTVKGKIENITPDEREKATFGGWYYDAECTNAVNFDKIVENNTSVYARWIGGDVTTYTVTFNYNYASAPEAQTVSVPENEAVSAPATPTRADVNEKGHQAQNFTFGGWYTDKECTKAYNLSANVTEDLQLYAKWTGTYIFEAEHVSLTTDGTPDGEPLHGMGASGGSEGANMVDGVPEAALGMNGSNGYYVTYLYAPGLGLIFNIESDRDVEDATLIFRITCESRPFALDPVKNGDTAFEDDSGDAVPYSMYVITVNGQSIMYDTIMVKDASGHEDTGGRRPFSDHVIAVNLSLKKGMNSFSFLTANMNGMGGTMAGTAPVIDCIKITTSAELSWEPVTGNEFGQ